MAVRLLGNEVSDLCIGKPGLRSLPPSATVADALLALRRSGDAHIAVFVGASATSEKKAVAAGRVSIGDIICSLCREDGHGSPAAVLAEPASALLPKGADRVRYVEPHSSVSEALDVILQGAPTLVLPIRAGGRKKLQHQEAGATSELCLLTQEDFVRHFLNSIAVFSPAPNLTIEELGLVRPANDFIVRHDEPALVALPPLRRALADQTAVAVVTDDGKLLGEIAPAAIAACDETVAAAIATLSAGDLMAYIDCFGSPPAFLVREIKSMLKEKGMKGMLKLMEEDFSSFYSNSNSTSSASSSASSSSSSSSDEEGAPGRKRHRRPRSRNLSTGRRSDEAVVCHPGSSLMAAMVQALAHRVSYLWVVDELDYSLIGIVTFADVLRVLLEQVQ